MATLWFTYFVGSAFPLEMLKSPLEKAKIELEKNIFLKLGKSINAYEYKYVSIIYANEPNGRVCYTTIEETLAHCFLKNTWDRERIVSLIDKCGKTDINKMDFQKDNSPYFLFDGRVNNISLPCKSSFITSFTVSVYFSQQRYERNKQFHVYSAIYHTNKSLEFTPQTQWDVAPEVVIDIAQNLDFDDIYTQYINKYWKDNFFNYSKHLRVSYLQSVIYQHKESSLSEKGAFLALQAAIGAKDVSVYFVGLQKSPTVLAYTGAFLFMNNPLLYTVVNYAYNIMCVRNNTDGHTLLYVLGNSSPIHEFSSIIELNSWFVNQTKDDDKRRILLSHFMLNNLEATLTHLSLEDTLKSISELNLKEYHLDIAILNGPYPSGPYFFSSLTNLIKKKSINDIPTLIVSNRDVTKNKILEWLDVVSTIVLPFALVFPEVIVSDVVFLAQGLIQVGIAVDDLAHHKNVGEQRLVFGLLNAAPVVPAAFRWPKAIKSFHAKLNNILSSDEKALLKLEAEETQRLPLDYATSGKTQFSEGAFKTSDISKTVGEDDLNKDTSESFEASELSVEHSDLKFDKGASKVLNIKTSSSSRDELQHLVKSADMNFKEPSLNTQKLGVIVDDSYVLDLDTQASSMGKKIITMKGKQYLVDHVNNEIKSLYTFELVKGKISKVKNTGKSVYYNKKTELWELLRLKGGTKEGSSPTKIRKLEREGSSNTLEQSPPAELENPNNRVELEREGSGSALDHIDKFTFPEIENPSNLPKDGRPYRIVNFKKELNMVVYDKKVNGYRYADVRTSNNYLSVTIENELVEVSTNRPIIIPDESYIQDLTKAQENSFDYDKIEGPENEGYITGIVFREKRFTVMYKGEMRTVLYDKFGKYWHLEGSTRQLEYTSNKEWVELQERNSFPIENKYLTHEKLNWDLPALESTQHRYKVPTILNFILIEGVDKSAANIIKEYKNAYYYPASESSEKSAKLYVYGNEPFIKKIKSERKGFPHVKVINLNNKDNMDLFFEDELHPYMKEGCYDLVSLLARLKLSQENNGLFLTNKVHVPPNIFDRTIVTDETGFLFQTPVLDERAFEYVVPTDVIASHVGANDKPLLDAFLYNLKEAKYNGKLTDNHALIFTQSIKESLANYREYLKYFSSIKGNDIKITANNFKRVNDYFEQFSNIGFQNYEVLASDQLVSSFLSKDPADVNLMITNNVQIITLKDQKYIVFPTKCNIRELYSYKKTRYHLTNVRSTGKTVYFTENGGVQVLEEVSTFSTSEGPPAKKISVPMNKVYSGGNSKLFAYEHHILVKGARRKVLYDYEYNTWRDYSYSETKITLGPSLKLKNGNWVESNLLAEENELSGNTLPEVKSLDNHILVKNYYLPIIPKRPNFTQKLKKNFHFFIQDIKGFENFRNTLNRLPPQVKVYLHYDFISSTEQNFAIGKILLEDLNVKLKDVRANPSLRAFFKNNALSQYYEAARKNGRYEVARDIMKYQIMYENYGFFMNHEIEPSKRCFLKGYFARPNDILLKYPDKITYSKNVIKFRASNDLFGTFSKNPFFKRLNNNILKNLEKDNGYFGNILKGVQPKGAIFPLDEVVGASMFHKTIMENFPETKAIFDYMNQEFFSIIYNDEFEDIKAYFFPIIS